MTFSFLCKLFLLLSRLIKRLFPFASSYVAFLLAGSNGPACWRIQLSSLSSLTPDKPIILSNAHAIAICYSSVIHYWYRWQLLAALCAVLYCIAMGGDWIRMDCLFRPAGIYVCICSKCGQNSSMYPNLEILPAYPEEPEYHLPMTMAGGESMSYKEQTS